MGPGFSLTRRQETIKRVQESKPSVYGPEIIVEVNTLAIRFLEPNSQSAAQSAQLCRTTGELDARNTKAAQRANKEF